MAIFSLLCLCPKNKSTSIAWGLSYTGAKQRGGNETTIRLTPAVATLRKIKHLQKTLQDKLWSLAAESGANIRLQMQFQRTKVYPKII